MYTHNNVVSARSFILEYENMFVMFIDLNLRMYFAATLCGCIFSTCSHFYVELVK